VPSGWLRSRLDVAPHRWGSGIGSVLHDRMVELAAARGLATLNLWVLDQNRRARTMCERRGWHHVEGTKLVNDDPAVYDVHYELSLDVGWAPGGTIADTSISSSSS
jgi:hypothetical protein